MSTSADIERDAARRIWRQATIPVIWLNKERRRGDRRFPLLVKLPFSDGNHDWLQSGKRYRPKWIAQFMSWSVPVTWFEDVIRRALQRYRRVYVIQPFRKQEKCAPACWAARKFKCTCSCMGEHHGSDGAGWFVASETCAIRYGGCELACRLIVTRTNGVAV